MTLVLPLQREDWAALRMPYPMTENDWAMMMDLLNLMRPALVPTTPEPVDGP